MGRQLTYSKDRMVDLDGIFHAQSELAYLIDFGDAKTWVPKSKVELDGKTTVGAKVTVIIPEWLAIAKGLV